MIPFLLEKKYDRLVQDYIATETPYHFIEVIGIGSYGVAYLLEDSASNKFVLKRMKTKHRLKKYIHEKFNQEITFLKELGLPNVPSLISHGQIQGIPIYIMEYIDGKTFEQAIFQVGQTFTLEQALGITQELLQIIVEFHRKGIVHRDLRIPNILLKDRTLYIIDFGLAAHINENLNLHDINNPKQAKNHISDLYYIGHFLLFLLYSNYSPTQKKELSWQLELQLPPDIIDYIEKLLLIRPPFISAEAALSTIPIAYTPKHEDIV